MLDNHEFRRDMPGEGVLNVPFTVPVFSVEPLLVNPGRCGIFFGVAGAASFGG